MTINNTSETYLHISSVGRGKAIFIKELEKYTIYYHYDDAEVATNALLQLVNGETYHLTEMEVLVSNSESGTERNIILTPEDNINDLEDCLETDDILEAITVKFADHNGDDSMATVDHSFNFLSICANRPKTAREIAKRLKETPVKDICDIDFSIHDI